MKTNKFKSDAVYSEDESGIVNPKDYKNDKDTGHTPMSRAEQKPEQREDARLGKANPSVPSRQKMEENPAGFSGHKEDRDYSYNSPKLHPEPDEKSQRPTQQGHGTVNRSLRKVKPLAEDLPDDEA